MILIKALEPILGYLQEVALTPDFENPPMVVVELPPVQDITEEDWTKIPEEEKPEIMTVDPEVLKEQLRQQRRWRRFEKTGQAPNSDDDDDESEIEEGVKLVAPGEDWNSW